jgi:hypothetical protein
MVKLIGIMVLSAHFLVAIEGQSPQAERSFANSREGVELLVDYLEQGEINYDRPTMTGNYEGR